MDALKLALGKGPFICGDQFTGVDVYLGSSLNWGMQFGTIEKRPKFEEYVQRLVARPAALRADQINEVRSQNQAAQP
jgi:glutathione S-transferase